MRRFRDLALVALALLSACAPTTSETAPTSATPPTASSFQSSPGTQQPPPLRYNQTEIFGIQREPTALALSDSQLFVAEIDMGARPTDVRSMTIVSPLGGGAPTLVSGSETPSGVGVLGITVYRDALYLSQGSNADLRSNGVFRLIGAQSAVIAGGPNGPSDLNTGNGDGGPATAAAIQGPQGLAFSGSGDLFIAEAGDSRIRVVRGTTISTYAGNGSCSPTGNGPAGSPATSLSLCNPGLVVIDREGSVYVAQRSGAKWIAKIDPAGTVTTLSNGFVVSGLAIDTDGSLLAANASDGSIVRLSRSSPSAPPVVLASNLGAIKGLAAAKDGSIYFASSQSPVGTARSWKIIKLTPTS